MLVGVLCRVFFIVFFFSLQAEDISNELLNDVQTVLDSNKIDDSLLTWL